MCVVNKQFEVFEFLIPFMLTCGNLCGCGGCYNGDACTVLCVACVYADTV